MNLKIWIKELRAPFLLLSIFFAPVGISIAWYQGSFNLIYAILTIVGSVSLHASANVLNDFFDYKSGIDLLTPKTPFSGGSGILPLKMLNPKPVMVFGFGLLAIGVIIGLYFLTLFSFDPILISLLSISVLSVSFYSQKLSYMGLGEFIVGLNFGPLLVLGAYYIQTRTLAFEPLIAGTVLGIMTAGILYINEFPDMEADKSGGRIHLVARLGKRRAASYFKLLIGNAYFIITLGVILRLIHPFTLIVLITVPNAIKAIRILENNYQKINEIIPSMGMTVKTTISIAILFLIVYFFLGIFF
jgi:1,4-dihydroxy-2-naphthoate octaprenyltransferase